MPKLIDENELFIQFQNQKRRAVKAKCLVCESDFLSPIGKSKKFCSKECKLKKDFKFHIKINCAGCNKELERTPSKLKGSKSGLFFCGKECKDKNPHLVKYKGKTKVKRFKVKCTGCEKSCRNDRKYCSQKCCKTFIWNKTKIEVETNQAFPHNTDRRIIRRYMFEKFGCKCTVCGLETWQGKPIPVNLDHINGNSEDNRLSNLRLICCNCDAQTPTYKSRNRGNGRSDRRQRYADGKSY